MRNLQHAALMLRRSRKETGALMLTLTLSTALIFLFVNLQLSAQTYAVGTTDSVALLDYNSLIFGAFTIVIIIVCTVNSFIANAYFLKSKALELCVYLSSGMHIFKLARYLFAQSIIVLLISTILGGIIGIIMYPLVTMIVIQLTSIEMPLFDITPAGASVWLLSAAYQCFFMLMFNIGYAYKAELKELLDEGLVTTINEARMFVIPDIFYSAACIAGLVIIVLSPPIPMFFFLGIGIGIMGIQGIVRYKIPGVISARKQSHTHMESVNIVVLGNFDAILKAAYSYIIMLITALLFISSLMTSENTSDYIRFFLCLGYILMMLMMCISIYFKLMVEVKKHESEFLQLQLMGYNSTQLKQCIHKEMKLFFVILLSAPLPYAILICMKYIWAGVMAWWMSAFLILSYVIFALITAAVTTRAYKKTVLRVYQGGEEDAEGY